MERASEGWGKEFITQQVPASELQQEICHCVSALVETQSLTTLPALERTTNVRR